MCNVRRLLYTLNLYRENMRNGFHKVFYPKGGRYEGEFKDGKYHGQGVYTFADGEQYKGNHKDGRAHGH